MNADHTWTITVADGDTGASYRIELTLPHGDPLSWLAGTDGNYHTPDYEFVARRLGQAARDCFKQLIDKRHGHQ